MGSHSKQLVMDTHELSNRCYQVNLNEQKSKSKRLNNNLPLGSVLASLFHYMSKTTARLVLYADDPAIVY